MSTRIAVANQKGGVGKTATVINLGAALAKMGAEVLLVDMDPQGSLSLGLGISKPSISMGDVLRLDGVPLTAAILAPATRLDLVPANVSLAEVELALSSHPGRENLLRRKLAQPARRYDYVLIDCPPSLSLLTVMALVAADAVIIPVQCEYFALKGMERLMDTIRSVKNQLNPALKIAGILPTMYSRTTHSKEVLEELRRAYPGMVFSTVVRRTIRLSDGALAGRSIIDLKPQSGAANEYMSLAREVHSAKAG